MPASTATMRGVWQFPACDVAFDRFKGGARHDTGIEFVHVTTVHVDISLIGIVAGIIVMFGMLGSSRMPGEYTAIFLLFTILTSATGFLFPVYKLTPADVVGALSLVLLAIACIALYGMKLSGAWRWIYVVTAMISLYLNVFVLVIQGFLKIALRCMRWRRATLRRARHSPLPRASCWCSSSL